MRLVKNPFIPKKRKSSHFHSGWKHHITFHFQSTFQFLFLNQQGFQVKRKWIDFLIQMVFYWAHNSKYDFRTSTKLPFVSFLDFHLNPPQGSNNYSIFSQIGLWMTLVHLFLQLLYFSSAIILAYRDGIHYQSI